MLWAVRRMHLLGVPAAILAMAGYLLFRIPYVITETLARLGRPKVDQVSTFQLMVGVPVYVLWGRACASPSAGAGAPGQA